MLNASTLIQLKANVGLVIMTSIVLLLPLFKGGNYSGVMPIFVFAMGVVFLLSISEISYNRDKYWFVVWAVVSVSVLIHAVLYPYFLVNERFFIDGLSPQIAAELNAYQLSKIRMIEVWSFFTVMWLFAWKTSLFELKQLRIFLLVLFVALSFQALFGVVHFLSGSSSILGLWTKEFYLGDATGTFVNRNHFAGMLAIASPIVLSAILMQKPLIFPLLPKAFRIAVALLYLVILVLALISSHSRMGVVAAIFGLIVCYFFMNKTRDVDQVQLSFLKLFSVLFFLFLFAVWFGLGDILQRYTELNDGNSRFDVWRAMFTKVPLDVWLFGVGPGSFEDVFQIIKPSNFSVRFVYAHNDYLEFLFEFGIILSCLILVSLFFWVKHFYQKFNKSNYFIAGVYGSFVAIGLHSLVDFNLQVPASAMCFWISVGLLSNSKIALGAAASQMGVASKQKPLKNKPLKRVLSKSKREWLEFLRSD